MYNTFCTAITRRNPNPETPLENDMEALISGLNVNKPHHVTVLIVDGNSEMRDYELHKEIDRPIHVISCPQWAKVHPQYLNLVYQTKGVLHTRYQDYENIHEVKDGGTIKIGVQKYLLKDGVFVLDESK
ncbi:MAG: hypothetical protein GY810_07505 [Aureispira sp.]|nr:hypothetical protein [Aureispira sp.]